MIKESVYQDYITILNVYIPKKNNLKSIKLREIDKPIIKDENINILLSIIGRIIERKISKDIEDLNKTNHQHDLINIYGIPHHRTAVYTFFKCTHYFNQDRSCPNHKIYLIKCK